MEAKLSYTFPTRLLSIVCYRRIQQASLKKMPIKQGHPKLVNEQLSLGIRKLQ
jgi:hypothetical protein